MTTAINFYGKLGEPTVVENGVKQWDILEPILLFLYFAVVLKLAFKDCHNGVYIEFRTFRKLFNIRHLYANTKVSMNQVCDLLYADDYDLISWLKQKLAINS